MPDAAPGSRHADVLIYVQHLLGIGHLRRISRIAAGAAADGLTVQVASGGFPVPGMDFGAARVEQLAPVRSSDTAFSGLADADGRPVDDAWMAARRERLLALFEETRPGVLLLELFPFGRQKFAFELLPLLQAAQAARPRPRVAVSLRDVPNPLRRAERTAWALEVVEHYVDSVLVHGDPSFIRLEEIVPEAARIADRIAYTGYVAPPPVEDPPDTGEILVSSGGGATGRLLAPAALQARAHSRRFADTPWRMLVGHNYPDDCYRDLRDRCPSGMTVRRTAADFLARLAGCRASVNQCGYNTFVEVLPTGVPAVFVPFEGPARDREQLLRARRLAERSGAEVVTEDELTPAALAAALDRAAGKPHTAPPLDLDGIAGTARLLRALADQGVEAPVAEGRA